MNTEPTTRDVLDALNALSTRVEDRFERIETTLDTVATEVVGLRVDMDDVKGRLGSVETRLEEGFGRLDGFVTELGRHNQEIVANRSASRRHEDRLEALEKAA